MNIKRMLLHALSFPQILLPPCCQNYVSTTSPFSRFFFPFSELKLCIFYFFQESHCSTPKHPTGYESPRLSTTALRYHVASLGSGRRGPRTAFSPGRRAWAGAVAPPRGWPGGGGGGAAAGGAAAAGAAGGAAGGGAGGAGGGAAPPPRPPPSPGGSGAGADAAAAGAAAVRTAPVAVETGSGSTQRGAACGRGGRGRHRRGATDPAAPSHLMRERGRERVRAGRRERVRAGSWDGVLVSSHPGLLPPRPSPRFQLFV